MCPSKPLWIGSEERYFLQRLREPVNDIVPHSSNRLVSDSCLHLEDHTWLAVSIQEKMSPTSLPPCTCYATPIFSWSFLKIELCGVSELLKWVWMRILLLLLRTSATMSTKLFLMMSSRRSKIFRFLVEDNLDSNGSWQSEFQASAYKDWFTRCMRCTSRAPLVMWTLRGRACLTSRSPFLSILPFMAVQ